MEVINWPGRNSSIQKLKNRLLNKVRGQSDIYGLIDRGMKVGEYFWVGDNCAFESSFCWLIEIGNHVTFSNRVQLIAHDSSLFDFVHVTKLGKIVIDDYAFIGARSTILPGVHIGEGAIITAGSLVTKDVPPGEVWGGSPAKKIAMRCDIESKFTDPNNVIVDNAAPNQQETILEALQDNRFCYIQQ